MNQSILDIISGEAKAFGTIPQTDTVNVDIFACVNFRGFVKMGSFA